MTFAATSAEAAFITFTGSGTGPGSVPVSASANFDITGNNLTITLRNTSVSNNGQDVPGGTLTGLFFDLVGNWTLTPFSATIPTGSSIVQGANCNASADCTSAQTNVGGEFGYGTSFKTTDGGSSAPAPGGADRGIASAGYLTTGLAGNIGNFNNGAAGTNLDDPASLDGINFGIISAASGFNPNGGLSGVPLIQDSVVFVLTGASGLTIADISHVSFQYGTALSELNVPGIPVRPDQPVPEPASMLLLGAGLAALAGIRRRGRS